MRKIISLFLLLIVSHLYADYAKGEAIFNAKCSSCHGTHIPMQQIIDNFYQHDNKMLKLTVPTVNMLAYAIMDGAKHIGDRSDPEMRQMEIEEYLMEYLESPDPINSICDAKTLKYYDKKKSMKGEITMDEVVLLTTFFMEYAKVNPEAKKKLTKKEQALLKQAKEEKKLLMLMATASYCHYCEVMKKEIMREKDVAAIMDEHYIFVEIDIEKGEIPFGEHKNFQGLTPTFFVISPEGELINKYPGSWNKSDYMMILKENVR
jgi:thioredoxin-related protein